MCHKPDSLTQQTAFAWITIVENTEILVSVDWICAFKKQKNKKLSSIGLRLITDASFLGIRKITHNKLWWHFLGRKEEQMSGIRGIMPVGEPSVSVLIMLLPHFLV